MTTKIRVSNLAPQKSGSKSIVVRPIHIHGGPLATTPTVINPGDEYEFNVSDTVRLQVEENTGINDA